MAITFFGVGTTPADNSSQAGPTVTVTPPGSMVDGDLVVVYVKYRDSAATISDTPSNTGGQSWNLTTQYNTTNIRARVFWCRFNGTWSADPGFTVTSGTNNMDVQMLVFRPTSATYTWTLESGPNSATYSAPSTPFTVTVTGRNTTAESTVSIAAWHSVDDNSWGSLSGTGWSKTSLGAQYRNNSTSDNSSSYAYRIMTSSGATNNVSQNQSALGGDAGSTSLFTFAETLVNAAISGVAATLAAGSLGISIAHVGLAGLESTTAVGTATAATGGAGSNATAEPTAATATASAGSVQVNVGAAPAGVSSTASAGTLAPNSVIVPVGASATASAGTAAVEQTGIASPSGVEATSAVGTAAPIALAVFTPTGVGIGATAASLIPHVSIVPVGASATASAGDATGAGASGGAVPIPSVVSNAAAGLLSSATTTAGIAGVESVAAAGTASVSAGGIILGAGQPSAVFATAQAGSLAALPAITATGVFATATAEEIGSSVMSAEIDGVQVTLTAAAIAPAVASPILGTSASASAGSVAVFGTAAPTVTGVQSVATVGNLSGVTEGFGTAAIGGVESETQAGTLQADWTAILELEGVEITTAANDVTVQAGDNEPAEAFPAGVSATAQVGTVSTGEARAALDGFGIQAQAGVITGVARNPFLPPVDAGNTYRPPGRKDRHKATKPNRKHKA